MMDHFSWEMEIGPKLQTCPGYVRTHTGANAVVSCSALSFYLSSISLTITVKSFPRVSYFYCCHTTRLKLKYNFAWAKRSFELESSWSSGSYRLLFLWDKETWLQHEPVEGEMSVDAVPGRGSSFSPHTEPLQSWITELEKQLIALSSRPVLNTPSTKIIPLGINGPILLWAVVCLMVPTSMWNIRQRWGKHKT